MSYRNEIPLISNSHLNDVDELAYKDPDELTDNEIVQAALELYAHIQERRAMDMRVKTSDDWNRQDTHVNLSERVKVILANFNPTGKSIILR